VQPKWGNTAGLGQPQPQHPHLLPLIFGAAPHLADFATFGFKALEGSSLTQNSPAGLALKAIDI